MTIDDGLMCENGDPADANGNCDGDTSNSEIGGGDLIVSNETKRRALKVNLNLTRDQINWIANDANIYQVGLIYDYLQNNQFDGVYFPEAVSFASLAVSTWTENTNASVNFEEQIINELTGKAECAYDKLISSSISNYHSMITDLFIEFGNNNIEGRDLTFKMSTSLPNTVGGRTLVDSNGDYHILINSNLMNTLSSIEVAAIIIHEIAHAFLGKHYSDSNATFKELYKRYINDTGIKNYSHDIMRDQFINRMATVLRNYDTTIFSAFEEYKILASQGVFKLSTSQSQALTNAKITARNNDTNCD